MVKVNYELIGNKSSGRAIVLLHGWGLCGDGFDRIISGLDKNCLIIKLDLMGFGKSPNPKEYFDTHEYAYQIFLFLKRIGVQRVVLVGHSFGGRIAVLLSSVYEINVEGLVLASSAGLNRFSLEKYIKIKYYKFLKYLVRINMISGKVLGKFGSRDYKNSSDIMRHIMVRVVSQDLSIYAKKISCKTILVWDRKDKETPFWICKKYNRLIKSSKIFCYKTGGHFVVFKNAYKFSRLINDEFLIYFCK